MMRILKIILVAFALASSALAQTSRAPSVVTIRTNEIFARSVAVQMPTATFPLTGSFTLELRRTPTDVSPAHTFSTGVGNLRIKEQNATTKTATLALLMSQQDAATKTGNYQGDLVYNDGVTVRNVARFVFNVVVGITNVTPPAPPPFTNLAAWEPIVDIFGAATPTLIAGQSQDALVAQAAKADAQAAAAAAQATFTALSDQIASAQTTVPSNASLAARPSTFASAVARLGYSALGDSPAVVFRASNAVCSLNSGAGDGMTQVASSDGKCWVAQLGPVVAASSLGIDAAGPTDASARLNALFDAAPLTSVALTPGVVLNLTSPITLTKSGAALKCPAFQTCYLNIAHSGDGITINPRLAQTTLTTTSGSTSATVASATNIRVGDLINASSVGPSTTVSAIAGTNITLSAAATATGANAAKFGTKIFNFDFRNFVVTRSVPAAAGKCEIAMRNIAGADLINLRLWGQSNPQEGICVRASQTVKITSLTAEHLKGSAVVEEGYASGASFAGIDAASSDIQVDDSKAYFVLEGFTPSAALAARRGAFEVRDHVGGIFFRRTLWAASPGYGISLNSSGSPSVSYLAFIEDPNFEATSPGSAGFMIRNFPQVTIAGGWFGGNAAPGIKTEGTTASVAVSGSVINITGGAFAIDCATPLSVSGTAIISYSVGNYQAQINPGCVYTHSGGDMLQLAGGVWDGPGATDSNARVTVTGVNFRDTTNPINSPVALWPKSVFCQNTANSGPLACTSVEPFTKNYIDTADSLLAPKTDPIFNNSSTITSTAFATLVLRNTGGGLDRKLWDITTNPAYFRIRAINDAYNAFTNVLDCVRTSGITVSVCDIGVPLTVQGAPIRPSNIVPFASSGAYTRSAGVTHADVYLFAGGGGGGSGARQAAGAACSGGSGGGGGGAAFGRFTAAQLGSSQSVTVGLGGTGAAAQTVNSTAGITGGNGGETTFGSLLRAHGAGGGAGGQLNSNSGGGGGASNLTQGFPGTNLAGGSGSGGFSGGYGAGGVWATGPYFGAGGAGGVNGAAGLQGGGAYLGASSGASGGGISAANVAFNGGPGGPVYVAGNPILAGGGVVGGAKNGATGSTWLAGSGPIHQSGAGGGGGAADLSAAGGAGGAGGLGSGGGGGGGCSRDGNPSGAGGAGGAGYAYVIEYF